MSELNNQLEDAVRQMGGSIEGNEVEQPQPEVLGETTEQQPQEPAAEEPVAEPTAAKEVLINEPLPSEDVLTITDKQEEEPASSLNDENETTSEEPEEDFDIDSAVTGYLSEKLGMEISSIDDIPSLFQKEEPKADIDERLKVIADFMEKTGRTPEDWFTYQSIKPDEISDLDAVRYQLQNQYNNLSAEEVDLLLSNKYKLDTDTYSEDEIKFSSLQLKIDAADARKSIAELRDNYLMPVVEQKAQPTESVESPINEQWISSMSADAESLEAITFQLGDSEFNFGISDDYRRTMIDKNANLENFFDDYIYDNGSWDYEKLNMHRAVLDNIDEIVNSVYKHGLSDGQRNLVNKAANVDVSTPKVNPQSADGNQDLINDIVEKLRPDNRLKLF